MSDPGVLWQGKIYYLPNPKKEAVITEAWNVVESHGSIETVESLRRALEALELSEEEEV